MGRHSGSAATGSRRATVLTLTASVLLVIGGLAILHASSGLRLGSPRASGTPVPSSSAFSGASRSGDADNADDAEEGIPRLTQRIALQRTMAHQVVALVEVERERAGCGPVSPDAALQRVAQAQSDDMADRGYVSLTSTDGTTLEQRLRLVGFPGRAVAGTLAVGQPTAQAVMSAWMSTAHDRATILDCAYDDIGVGYATGGSAGTYWTQAFGG